MMARYAPRLPRRAVLAKAAQLAQFPPPRPAPRPPPTGPRERTRWLALLLGAGVLLAAGPAVAAPPACELRGRPWIEGRIRPAASARGAAPARAVDARGGETIDAFLVLPGTLDGRPVLFSEDGSPGRVSFQRSGCAPLQISWRRVEPRLAHTSTRPPNPGLDVYSNAVVFGPRHGQWLGYDQLEYFATPLSGATGLQLTLQDASPTAMPVPPREEAYKGLGTMRLAATVQQGAKVLSTPGEDDAPKGQIDARVFRYSFRSGDGFVGWLTSFFNVPYLFGSAGDDLHHQAERYIGADCADVLVAALRRAGLRRLHYTNVGGVIDAVGHAAGPAVVRPCPAESPACASVSEPPLRYGAEVLPGDILAVDYVGSGELPRAWDHIVVLVEDRGPGGVPDGVLGPDDLVLDSGDARALKLAPLAEQGEVRVLAARPRGVPAF